MEPITRKEMFMAKASGQDINTPKPITREEMFLNRISGGGVSSWNDLTDRPFGEESVVLFDQTIDFAQENPYAGEYRVNEAWPINVGDTVVVTWDGVRYECVATTAPFDGVGFGDVSGMSGGESTGEPFSGIVSSEQQQSIIFAKDQTVHSVKVEAMEIKTLDPKFIPDGVGGGAILLYAKNSRLYKDERCAENDEVSKEEALAYARSVAVVKEDGIESYMLVTGVYSQDYSDYASVSTSGVEFHTKEYYSGGGATS